MTHPIYQARAVEVIRPYTLRVQFTDDTEQTINLKPILAGELYGPLLDPELFNRVSIDPEVKTLIWPNGADFDPAYVARLADLPRVFCGSCQEMGTRFSVTG